MSLDSQLNAAAGEGNGSSILRSSLQPLLFPSPAAAVSTVLSFTNQADNVFGLQLTSQHIA
jgi:hypothetical protein